jgi:hypothetical protein
MHRSLALFTALLSACPLLGAAAPAPSHLTVRFDPALGELHGRLLVFLTHGPVNGDVEPGYVYPREVEVLGTEVDGARAGSSIELPLDGDS